MMNRTAVRKVLGQMLPVTKARYNLREIVKQCVLLEDHLFQKQKRCPDCIVKHFLTIEALFEEAITLDKEGLYIDFCEKMVFLIRSLQEEWLDGEYEAIIAQVLRKLRKTIQPYVFDLRVATKTHTEKEDEEADKLVKPLPKKKPPRKDKRNEKVKAESDPDISNMGAEEDRDLSLNYKKVAWLYLARETHKPGDVWKTESGKWTGKSPKGDNATFSEKENAKEWAQSGSLSSTNEEDEQDTEEATEEEIDPKEKRPDPHAGLPDGKDNEDTSSDTPNENRGTPDNSDKENQNKSDNDNSDSTDKVEPSVEPEPSEGLSEDDKQLLPERDFVEPDRTRPLSYGEITSRMKETTAQALELSPKLRKEMYDNLESSLKNEGEGSPRYEEIQIAMQGVQLAAIIQDEDDEGGDTFPGEAPPKSTRKLVRMMANTPEGLETLMKPAHEYHKSDTLNQIKELSKGLSDSEFREWMENTGSSAGAFMVETNDPVMAQHMRNIALGVMFDEAMIMPEIIREANPSGITVHSIEENIEKVRIDPMQVIKDLQEDYENDVVDTDAFRLEHLSNILEQIDINSDDADIGPMMANAMAAVESNDMSQMDTKTDPPLLGPLRPNG